MVKTRLAQRPQERLLTDIVINADIENVFEYDKNLKN